MKNCPNIRHVRGGASNMSPVLVEKIWGGRALGRLFNLKLPKGKLIGEYWAFYDKRFPIVIKLIDVKKPLSVQVHPFGKKGKSELWYVVKAGRNARVLGGITLHKYKVRPGNWVYLAGGTVHTILPPAVLLEVSQENLITYRLYDWGRGTRPLDIEKGIKNIRLDARPVIYKNIERVRCPFFSVRLRKLKKNGYLKINGICFVLKGRIKIKDGILEKGNSRFIDDNIYALSYSEVFCVNWTARSSNARL